MLNKPDIAKTLLNKKIMSRRLYVAEVTSEVDMNTFHAQIRFLSVEGDITLNIDVYEPETIKKIYENSEGYKLEVYEYEGRPVGVIRLNNDIIWADVIRHNMSAIL